MVKKRGKTHSKKFTLKLSHQKKLPKKKGMKRVSPKKRLSKSPPNKNNIRLVIDNLIIFFLLFLVFLVLTQMFSHSSLIILQNLFEIFSMAFAFITIAFLITLLVFLFIRILNKK